MRRRSMYYWCAKLFQIHHAFVFDDNDMPHLRTHFRESLMCMYIYILLDTYMYIHDNALLHLRMYFHEIRMFIYALKMYGIFICKYIYTSIYIYTYIFLCFYIYIYMYTHIYICIYI